MLRQFYLAGSVVIFLSLTACSDAESQSNSNAKDLLEPNSCAVACPVDSAYSEIRGTVTCSEGFMPICQCANQEEKMAYCEARQQ